ncbi:hypothetical protein N7520_010426 [Penicillium odoratum]|uniref:uncharacterized protein n=1 Tax=Penicillium odoratum TaxID=1167516 RepID=UPI002549B815|nr:uncharacterized protein N7520_010426 [Penicillium odoratum]KAJ5745244.1 hypothetical protein N7520_010426 [Penicillium odoratum]
MGVAEVVHAIQPLRGAVVPIRTVQETRPLEEFDDAYVAEVNVKGAAKVIKALDSKYPRVPSLPLSHLRRFAKREILPASLRAAIEAQGSPAAGGPKTIFVVISPPLPPAEALQELLAPFAPETYGSNQPTASPDPSTPEPPPANIQLYPIKIPIQPPFNAAQAERWSRTLWPVVFNPAAPRSTVAPPPQILTRAQETIEPRAGYYLSLARKVADEAIQSGRGRGVGAVIVDPAIEAALEAAAEESGESSTERWTDAVLAVGGDVRFARSEAGKPSQTDLHPGVTPNPACAMFNADVEGGPDLHALMRAVELVARRRREDPEHQEAIATASTPQSVVFTDPQLSMQLSPLESYFLYQPGLPTTPTSVPAVNTKQESSPSPQKKRKHEEPNPESISASLDPISLNPTHAAQGQTQPTTPPLPAPPPSTVTTFTDPTTSHPLIEQAKSTPTSPVPGVTSRIRTRSQGGYLCTDLDIYMSHEPCLCCSMGLLLSRFRAVIFPRSGRMKSGGLASEPVIAPTPWDDDSDDETEEVDEKNKAGNERLYYGLHWRKELNWRALGFEFVEDEEHQDKGEDDVVFNA